MQKNCSLILSSTVDQLRFHIGPTSYTLKKEVGCVLSKKSRRLLGRNTDKEVFPLWESFETVPAHPLPYV